MATSLEARLGLTIGWTYTNSLDLSTPKDAAVKDWSDTLANGTAVDTADMIWHDSRTLEATTENLDLAGSLLNTLTGAAMTFAKIKGIAIRNTSITVGANLIVGGAASAQFINWVSDATDEIVIGPGGIFVLWNPSAAGYAVTATTGDLLKIDSGAATITYEIVLIGTSA